MKILLISPRFPHASFWSFDRALALTGRRATMPPLGLLTVAGLIPARHDLRLVDENVAALEDADLAWADVAFLSGMIVQRAPLEGLLARCRQHGLPSVVGGPLVSGCFEQLHELEFAPSVHFIGEAEIVLPRLIHDLEHGAALHCYAHVADEEKARAVRAVFGEDAHVHVAPAPNLDQSPCPRFDLIDLEQYHSMAVQASRGCPIACEFCDIWKQFGRKSRTGSAQRLLTQLDYLFTLGWRGRVFVVDDNFIGNVGQASQLLQALAQWQQSRKRFSIPATHGPALGLRRRRHLRRRFPRRGVSAFPFSFTTEADVRLGEAGPKMTALRADMQAAGFGAVFLGIETPSTAALLETGKRVNVGRDEDAGTHLLGAVERIQRAGLVPMSGFIIGFDHDPEDIDEAMIRFIEAAAIPMAMVGLLGVLPGTDLHARMEREGRLRGRLEGDQTEGFRLNFEPRGRSEAHVVRSYSRVLAALYGDDMRRYYARCEKLLGRLPSAAPRAQARSLRARLADLRTFLISLVAVRPRATYWRFLCRSLTRTPRHFARAVELALVGDHLHHLTLARLASYEAAQARPHSEVEAQRTATAIGVEAA